MKKVFYDAHVKPSTACTMLAKAKQRAQGCSDPQVLWCTCDLSAAHVEFKQKGFSYPAQCYQTVGTELPYTAEATTVLASPKQDCHGRHLAM